MMKKLICISLSLLLVFSLFAGCSNNENNEQNNMQNNTQNDEENQNTTSDKPYEGTTITHFNTKVQNLEFFEDFFSDFTKETGIEVEFDIIPSQEYAKVLPTRVASDDAPDTFQVFPGSSETGVITLAKEGALLDLSGTDMVDKMIDTVEELIKYEDKPYAIVTSQNILSVIYNKDAFDAAGIESTPENIDEFMDACEALKEAEYIPMTIIGQQGFFFEMLQIIPSKVTGPNPEFMKERYNGEAKFNSEPWKEAYNIMVDLKPFIPEKPLALTYDDARNMFASQKAAMWCNGNWEYAALEDAVGDDFQMGAFIFPANEPGEERYGTGSIAELFSVSSKTNNPEASKELLQYFSDNDALLLEQYNGFPVTEGAELNPESEMFKEILPMIQNSTVVPFLGDEGYGIPGMNDIFMKGQASILSGQLEIEEALNELDEFYKNNR